MLYPNGQEICKGDLVWWDEGISIGYVEAIVEDDSESNEPAHVLICRHPFRENYDSGERIYESEFVDEGFGLLSDEEANDFRRAEKVAIAQTTTPYVSRYDVTAHWREHNVVAWLFYFDGPTKLTPVEVPACLRSDKSKKSDETKEA